MEAVTRRSQLHPRRLTPGSGEGQGVAGQERQPGDSLATPAAVPVLKDRFAIGRW